MMKIGDAVKVCFSKYANFNGRARRSEFWWFYLCISIVNWIPVLRCSKVSSG